MKVKKRDGRIVDFNEQKIIRAILAAFEASYAYLSFRTMSLWTDNIFTMNPPSRIIFPNMRMMLQKQV